MHKKGLGSVEKDKISFNRGFRAIQKLNFGQNRPWNNRKFKICFKKAPKYRTIGEKLVQVGLEVTKS